MLSTPNDLLFSSDRNANVCPSAFLSLSLLISRVKGKIKMVLEDIKNNGVHERTCSSESELGAKKYRLLILFARSNSSSSYIVLLDVVLYSSQFLAEPQSRCRVDSIEHSQEKLSSVRVPVLQQTTSADHYFESLCFIIIQTT